MAVAKSKVIEGEFKDKWVFCFGKKPFIKIKVPATAPFFGVQKKVFLDSNTVSSYQILDSTSDVSFTSTMVRGAVGHAVAGDVGGIAGAMTATGYSSNVILITFKDGKKSLIDVNDMICDALKRECKYNINFDNNANNNYGFDIHKEIKCPHCKNVAYGAVGDKCPFCNRLYSMPEREHKKVDKIIIPLLIFCFPVGLILMWVNKSFYLKTRIILTIIFGIIFALAMGVGTSENKNVDESSSIDNAIVIEELI